MTQSVLLKNVDDTPLFSPREEFWHSFTHAMGFCLSVVASIVMVVMASIGADAWTIVGVSLFGSSLIILYAASMFYHCIHLPKTKEVLRLIDHIGIYILITGTYMPFVLVTLRGPWGWSIFGVVLTLAVAGSVGKILFGHRWSVLSTILYLVMGWLALVAIVPIVHALPPGGIAWLVGGGLAYTLGVPFYCWEKLPFHHVIWHLFVLAGSVCHFFAVYLYVL